MKKFNKIICINSRGAVTIFLIILLLPSFLFGGYCFDLARLEAAKTMLSSAGDLTLTSALTQYNKDLYNRYGLLATGVDENEKTVLSDYYDSMIESSSVVPGSSSSTINLIQSIRSYMSDPNAKQFDNLVQMSSNPSHFKITGVDETQITNPDTLRSQIIEYMKYRGPITLASGLLTKIKTIGDVDKQSNAVEKKVDYEDKLSDIGDACVNAYDAINAYNQALDNQSMSTAINNLKEANNMDEICEILSYHKKSNNKVEKWDKSKLSNASQLTSISQQELYQYIRQYFDMLSMLSESEKNESNSSLTIKGKDLANLKLELKSYQNKTGLESVKSIYSGIQSLNKKYSEYNKLYWYCRQYINNYKSTSNPTEEQTKEYKRINIFYNNFAYKYKNTSGKEVNSIIYTYQNTDINDYLAEVKGQLNFKKDAKITPASSISHELKTKLENVVDTLDNITKKLKAAETAKNNYKQAIHDLADSEFKANMQAQYDSSAAKLSKDDLKNLIKKTKQFQNYVLDVISSIDKGGTFYKGQNGNHIGKSINIENIANYSIAEDTSKADIQKNYAPFQTNGFKGNIPIKITTADKFYGYLNSICAKTKESNKKDKENNEASITNALKLAGGVNHDPVPNNDKEIKKKTDSGANSGSANDVYKTEESYNRKKTTKSVLTYFSNIGSTLQSFTNLKNIFNPDTSRDALYTMEYMTEMFTCYTDMKVEGLKNLNGEPLNATTCKYFASEIEYILSGLSTPNQNLNAVNGQIFSVRFVMNLIYAMSDASIANEAHIMAMTLASGVPFLIPVIKTLVICATALAESAIDLNLLLNNKSVAFIKTSTTFVCNNPGKIVKELSSIAVDEAKSVVKDSINNITDCITGKINGGIDSTEEVLDDYIENVSDNIANQISSTINSAISGKCTELLSDISNNASLTIDSVKEKLITELTAIKKRGSSSDLVSDIRNQMIDYLINSQIDMYARIVIEQKEKAVNDLEKALKDMQEKIDFFISSQLESLINNKVKEKISSTSSSLKSEINQIASNYSDKLKSATTEKINEAFDKFNTKINGKIKENSTNATSASGAGFSFSYKEYLQLFITMQLLDSGDSDSSQRRNLLNRTTDLISANLDIELDKLFTIVSMESSVDIKTSFINIVFDESKNGKVDFDLENIKKSQYIYEYKGMKGY